MKYNLVKKKKITISLANSLNCDSVYRIFDSRATACSLS